MGAHDQQPESTPDETPDESTERENDLPADQSEGQHDGLPLSRRSALATLVGIGGFSLASGTASAGKVKTWRKDRDADGQNLFALGTLAMQANGTKIANFEGDGLEIDGDGVLNASDTRTAVSDDGTLEVENAEDINFGSNLAVTDDSEGSVTVDADKWDSRVEAGGNDLVQIGGLQTIDNKDKISDFEGANLTIDGDTLDADTWDTDVDAGGNSLTGADTVETDNLSISNVGASVRMEGTLTDTFLTKTVITKTLFDNQDEIEGDEFVAADDGFYRISAEVTILDIEPGETVEIWRAVRRVKNGFTTRTELMDIDEVSSAERLTSVSFSSLHQLNSGDKLWVSIEKSESGDNDYTGEMQVHQVG